MDEPLKERVNELTTQITFEISEMFLDITNKRERDTKIIDRLGKQLARLRAELEIYKQQNEILK